jgi:hypothetical protein
MGWVVFSGYTLVAMLGFVGQALVRSHSWFSLTLLVISWCFFAGALWCFAEPFPRLAAGAATYTATCFAVVIAAFGIAEPDRRGNEMMLLGAVVVVAICTTVSRWTISKGLPQLQRMAVRDGYVWQPVPIKARPPKVLGSELPDPIREFFPLAEANERAEKERREAQFGNCIRYESRVSEERKRPLGARRGHERRPKQLHEMSNAPKEPAEKGYQVLKGTVAQFWRSQKPKEVARYEKEGTFQKRVSLRALAAWGLLTEMLDQGVEYDTAMEFLAPHLSPPYTQEEIDAEMNGESMDL